MALGSVASLHLAPSGSPLLTAVTCNLCGGESAVVSCSDCDSLHFCSSCDDMYHRHPKRKFHLRKSVTPNASQVQAAVTVQAKPMRHDIGHPSNMPIPPPRRKKSFNNLHQGANGSLDELANLRSNGVNWKAMLGNPNTTYVQGLQGSASDAYINESLAGPHSINGVPPPLAPQATTSATGASLYNNHHHLHQQQHHQWPSQSSMQRSFNVTPAMYASASELSAPTVASESITVPAASGTTASSVTAASIISCEPTASETTKTPSAIRKRTNSLSRRRNNSLQDLRRDDGRYATMVPFSYIAPPQLPPLPPGHPYSHFAPYNPYAHPYAYWDAYEANELDMNDDESSSESLDDEEEAILLAQRSQRQSQPSTARRSSSRSRRSSSRNRRSSSRSRMVPDPYGSLGHRSVSTYQLPPPPQPPGPMWPGYPMAPPPPPHPYFGGYPPNYHPGYYGSYVHSLASSPPGSIRSSSMARKRSLDNFSTASSVRASDTGHRTGNSGHRSSARQSLDRINYQRVTNSRNGKDVSASGKTGSIRSLTSSRFGDSDSDDDLLDEGEDFYSASDDATAATDVGNNGHATTEKVHHTRQHQAAASTSTGGSKSKRPGNFVKDTQGTCKSNGHRVSGRPRNASNGQVNEYQVDIDHHLARRNGNSDPPCRPLDGQWSCKHCTFINCIESDICEVCAKSNPQKFKGNSSPGEQQLNGEDAEDENGDISPGPKPKSGKILSVVKAIEAKVRQTQDELHYKSLNRNKLPGQRKESTTKSLSKGPGGGGGGGGSRRVTGDQDKGGNERRYQKGEEDEDEDGEKPLQVLTLTDDLVVSDELVREQIEIENELRRRRENEKRIERQNKRIEQERRLKVRGENENWTQSNLQEEEEGDAGECEEDDDEQGDNGHGDEDEEEDENMANGKVNRRGKNEHQSKRKDGKNKNEHLDGNEIEHLLHQEQGQEEDDEDDDEDEADGENEERMDLMSSTFGHSSIAPSVSPAEWKRLASKKKNVKRRKVTTKSTLNSNNNSKSVSNCRTSASGSSSASVNCISSPSVGKKSAHSSTTRGTGRTVLEETTQSNDRRGGAAPCKSHSNKASPSGRSNLTKKPKESFSVEVSVSENGKSQVEETLESLIASLANYKLNSNQLEKVIKNVTEKNSTSGSAWQQSVMNSCTSSSCSSSSSAAANGKCSLSKMDDETMSQMLKEALVKKLLLEEQQLINATSDGRAPVNSATCVTNNNPNNGPSAFATSAYPVSVLQPPGSIIALHPSQLTAASSHPHPHPWTQFAPSQQFFADPNTTLMLMTSQMRTGQRQGPIQSTGNGYYSHFTSINPYATTFATAPPAASSDAAAAAATASSMSTSITSTCNPVMDNGHLVAQKSAESTSEQGQKLNSKLSSTSSSDLIFGCNVTTPSASTAASAPSQVALSSNTTAAIEMIKILKEAKKKGFTVDEVEIALNCNSNKPIEWLEENWSQMVQSVQTLTNNSIILMSQNGASAIISSNNLIGLKDSRCYLRNSRGDIYLAVENALESFKMKNGISDSIIKITANNSRASASPKGGQSVAESTLGQVTSCESGPIFQNSLLNNQLDLQRQGDDDQGNVYDEDDDDDEDDFYSPDEEAIDSLITKWKLERAKSEINDEEICQLFQLTLGQNRMRQMGKNEDSVTVDEGNTSQAGNAEVESLRRYLIKKYFGSQASDASSASDAATDVGCIFPPPSSENEANSPPDARVNDKCGVKKKVKSGKLNRKDDEDVTADDESKCDTNCHLNREEKSENEEEEDAKGDEMLLGEKKIHLCETTARDEMCKDNKDDEEEGEDEDDEEEEKGEKDVNLGGTRHDASNKRKSKCHRGTFTLPGVDDVTADDSKITTTTSSKSSITSEKCTISDAKSKGRECTQFADGVKDANRELTLQGKQLHHRQSSGIKEAKSDFKLSGHLHHQQKHSHSTLQTNSTSSSSSSLAKTEQQHGHNRSRSLKYEENLDVRVTGDVQVTSEEDESDDQEHSDTEAQGVVSGEDKSPSDQQLANWTGKKKIGSSHGETGQVTSRAKVNAESLSITDDTFNGHPSHKSSAKSAANGLADPAVSSHNAPLERPDSVSSLPFDCAQSPVSDLLDPVVHALISFEREFKQLYECELCTLDFEIEKMVSMLACQHRACINCVKTYLTIQIRERQCIIIQCPFCTEPSFDPVKDDDEIFTYLSLMDQLIKNLLDEETYNLFQRKVRDRSLMKDPSFRWCINCSSGFVASPRASPTVGSSTATCPDCSTVVCIKCNQQWLPQHENVSCEVFGEWKRANDPEFAVKQLNTHLSQFGIDCPSCKFHYELAKGGCMHFHCVQCGYDFCGGCYRRFVSGSECSISSYCDKMGLHAHHPRNCLFYLRDKEPSVLKQLLDQSNISYNVKFESDCSASTAKTKLCPVMEQKRISNGYKDESCGRSTEFAGLCRLHYIEYLGQLIFKNNIDPIDIFEVYELELVLKRNNVQVAKTVDKGASNYRQVLVELIKEQCPLDPVV